MDTQAILTIAMPTIAVLIGILDGWLSDRNARLNHFKNDVNARLRDMNARLNDMNAQINHARLR